VQRSLLDAVQAAPILMRMTIDDLISDWKQMRITFVSQLQMLESGNLGGSAQVLGSRTADTIARLKHFIAELDAMIDERNSQTNSSR
jgi:hypothetical protein